MAVIGIGGILGVMYSVPLRRALVTGTDLPYPEGVAAAEVLKVGSGVGGAEENRRGLALIGGSTMAGRPEGMAYTSGGQGLWSTLDDYLAFARIFLGNGEVDGVRLLRPDK